MRNGAEMQSVFKVCGRRAGGSRLESLPCTRACSVKEQTRNIVCRRSINLCGWQERTVFRVSREVTGDPRVPVLCQEPERIE